MDFKIILCVLFTAMICSNPAFSAPFIPDDEEEILAIVIKSSDDAVSKNIFHLKKQLNEDEGNLVLAVNLATAYIKMAIENNDPRYYGLAEAVIKPWWNEVDHLELMMLKARILQFNHQFDSSIQVLSQIIENNQSAQALLMRGSLNQVLGQYAETKKDCNKLVWKTSSLVTATCFFSVDGFVSSPEKAKKLNLQLRNIIQASMNETLGVKLWSLGLAAESASLMRNFSIAEDIMQQGLRLKADDVYLLSLYADLLLKQGRYQACVTLLAPHATQTALLVRMLVAQNKIFKLNAGSSQQKNLDLRIREDLIKGDNRHLREYAYYQLYVKNDYQKALRSAQINWENQKEMNDALILYRAAYVLERNDVLENLQSWVEKNQVSVDFSAESLRI